MSDRSELALLVATEQRLDEAVAAARLAADAARADAHARARAASSRLETQIALEEARIARDLAAETARQEDAIAERARDTLARYEALHGAALASLARTLARRLLDEEDP